MSGLPDGLVNIEETACLHRLQIWGTNGVRRKHIPSARCPTHTVEPLFRACSWTSLLCPLLEDPALVLRIEWPCVALCGLAKCSHISVIFIQLYVVQLLDG